MNCALCILLTGCVNDIEKVKLLSNRKILPVESAENIRMLYSEGAHVQVEVTAPEMNRYQTENPYLEMPKGLRANFFNDSLRVTSWLTADYAIRHELDEKTEARKNVVVVNEKGDTLNTELLIWDERKEKLLSNQFVKITTKDQIILGEGFEADQDFSKYKIFNVKGTFPLPERKPSNSTHHVTNS